MKKILCILAALVLAVSPAFADVHIRMRVMNGMSQSETWISGKKQRMVSSVPMMASMAVVTRLDKNVEWDIAPVQKMYAERPVALPYQPGGAWTEEDDEALMQLTGGMHGKKLTREGGGCVPKMTKLPKTRTIAGIKATGYEVSCPGDSEKSTFWVGHAPLPFSPLAAIEHEMTSFQEAYAKAQYANFPAQERDQIIKNVQTVGMAMGEAVLGFPDLTKIPKGVALAMEMTGIDDSGRPQNMTLFEVAELSGEKADPAIFEIPPGFRKVPDIGAAMAQNMMGRMGLAGMEQGMTPRSGAFRQAPDPAQMMEQMAGTFGGMMSEEDMARMKEEMNSLADEDY